MFPCPHTFFEDFGIAERFGVSAIRDTFKRAFQGWKRDIVMLTNLGMTVNLLCWEHQNESLCAVYRDCWYEVYNYVWSDDDNCSEEERQLFFRYTD